MFDALILLVMAAIAVSLGSGLFFLVKDRSKSRRTVISLSVRVALSVLLLALLAFGFFTRFMNSGD
ncbi:MAG TPA: twin transmembrane helix small protein [Gammaproteobacteria bacterium]|nr:twin transmembrane helix small protein [Gammaproteobacteria bacterium]